MTARKHVIAFFITTCLAAYAAVPTAAKKPPRSLVFPSKAGDVNFNHAAHARRQNNDCTTCHDKLWPQSTKVAIKSSEGCGTCHHADGRSFEMKGNCARCHRKQKSGGA